MPPGPRQSAARRTIQGRQNPQCPVPGRANGLSSVMHRIAIWEQVCQQRRVAAACNHLTLGIVPIWVLDATGDAKGTQKFIPPRDIKRVRRAGAERAQTQRIKRNVQSDETILRHAKDEGAIETGAGKHPCRKKQERSSSGGLLGFDTRDAPVDESPSRFVNGRSSRFG